jgi:hypothetical protein
MKKIERESYNSHNSNFDEGNVNINIPANKNDVGKLKEKMKTDLDERWK